MGAYNILTPKEKSKIVFLHLAEGQTLESLATEYNVSKSSISRWVKEFRLEAQEDPATKKMLDLCQQINQLLKEKRELEKEKACLIKAAAFFGQE